MPTDFFDCAALWIVGTAVVMATLTNAFASVPGPGHPTARPWRRTIVGVIACLLVAGVCVSQAAEEKGPAKDSAEKPAPCKLVAPKNWPAGHPLPTVASNCAACHLTAGRELTAAVEHFVRSVHDLNALTCYDCHGGNREDDARAHEEDFDFIGTKISAI